VTFATKMSVQGLIDPFLDRQINMRNTRRKDSHEMANREFSFSRGLKPEEEVVEAQDPNTGATYFFNKQTRKSSWVREEVSQAEAAHSAVIVESDIEEKVDPASGKTYFFNRKAQKSGWTRDEVREDISEEDEVAHSDAYSINDAHYSQMKDKIAEINKIKSQVAADDYTRAPELPALQQQLEAAANAGDHIEERLDPNTGATYFFNRKARKSGWTREAVASTELTQVDTEQLEMVQAPHAQAQQAQAQQAQATKPSPALLGHAAEAGAPEDDIEERQDPKSGATYFFNRKQRKSGWTREEVQGVAEKGGVGSTIVQNTAVEFVHTFVKGALGMSVGVHGGKVLVTDVTSTFGSAKSKGIQKGDVVIAINGRSVVGLGLTLDALTALDLKQELITRPLVITISRAAETGRTAGTTASADVVESGVIRVVTEGAAGTAEGVVRVAAAGVASPAASTAEARQARTSIAKRVDHATGAHYFVDTDTGDTAWTQTELLQKAVTAPATQALATAAAPAQQQHLTDVLILQSNGECITITTVPSFVTLGEIKDQIEQQADIAKSMQTLYLQTFLKTDPLPDNSTIADHAARAPINTGGNPTLELVLVDLAAGPV
jgi:hypothetical protein